MTTDRRTVLAAGGGAALGAIIANLMNRAQAAGGGNGAGGNLEIPQALLDAIALLAANSDSTLTQLNEILTAIQAMSGTTTLRNPNEIITFSVVAVVANTPVQFPEYFIAYDKYLVVRGNPANAGNCWVANTAGEAANPNSSWLLQANDVIGWKIYNTKQLWMSAAVAGDSVMVTGEKQP